MGAAPTITLTTRGQHQRAAPEGSEGGVSEGAGMLVWLHDGC